ncbi:MAG: hypothetical protein U9O98_10735 [Asgard group archaeon]|nr:hypothetical protein [Asgard group archaeon]
MFNRIGKALRIVSDEKKKKIAVIIDGPSLIPNFELENLKKLKNALNQIGVVKIGKIISNRQLTKDELNKIHSQGFQQEIVTSDIPLYVTLRAMEILPSEVYDIIAIGTTDPIFFPLFSRIKKEKNVALISWKEKITESMESMADYIIYLDLLE